jgi:hypothetical protein
LQEEDYETPFSGIDLKKYWHRRRVTPQCLRSSLKAIEVIGLRTTHEELVTIAYLMFAGKVLEQININLFKENDDGLNELRHGRTSRVLAKAKKASENLQININ